MIALEPPAGSAPLIASHFGPGPGGQPVGAACAASIVEFYEGWYRFTSETPVQIAVARDGPYALVGWSAGETGGTDLFHRRATGWCQIRHGGGLMNASDVIGLDGIDRARAKRLFDAPFTTVKLHAHS